MDESPIANTNPPRASFRNRFSNASSLSVRTLLPQYTLEATPSPDVDTDSPRSPNSTIATTNAARSFFRNRFSNASFSSINTLLPQYSVIDTLEDTASDVDTVSPRSPASWNSRYSGSTLHHNMINPPRYSLANLPHSFTPFARPEVGGDRHEFRYLYPIRPKKPWATLYLFTRNVIPGDPKPSQGQPRVPRFWSCDQIMGALELDLESPQNIHQIDVLV